MEISSCYNNLGLYLRNTANEEGIFMLPIVEEGNAKDHKVKMRCLGKDSI